MRQKKQDAIGLNVPADLKHAWYVLPGCRSSHCETSKASKTQPLYLGDRSECHCGWAFVVVYIRDMFALVDGMCRVDRYSIRDQRVYAGITVD